MVKLRRMISAGVAFGISISLAGCMVVARPAPVVVQQEPIVVQVEPPPLRDEVIIAAPTPRHVWVPGYWAWHGGWAWQPGHWAVPPHQRAHWVPGHWNHRGHDWVWVPGFWR